MARKLTRVALAISSAAMVLSLTASLAMAGEVKGNAKLIDVKQVRVRYSGQEDSAVVRH